MYGWRPSFLFHVTWHIVLRKKLAKLWQIIGWCPSSWVGAPIWEILDPSTIPYYYTYIYVIPAAVEFTQHKLPHIPF